LSERVRDFRKRRSRLQTNGDPAGNLDLDFEDSGTGKKDEPVFTDDTLESPGNGGSGFDLDLRESEAVGEKKDDPPLEMSSIEESGDEAMQLDAAPAGIEEMTLGEPLSKSPPIEIVVASPQEETRAEDEVTEGIYLAPLGRRFLAGLLDATVLILGAAIFGVIFWRFCGHLSLVPLNVVILGLVAVIHIFAYFGLFTAIASATPGLMWMGCEIRNLRGGYPTLRESFWRAFGVLVSLAALMLGFIWACVDGDGLSWHDRMSGTVITDEHSAPAISTPEVEA
jgi:uncharacterized RDD family membrane protein YckC